MVSNTIAVILGLVPPGLSVARELGRSGISVCGIGKSAVMEVGRFSRYVHCVIEYLNWDDLLKNLIEFGEKTTPKPVLIPTSDSYIFFIAENYKQLSELYIFQNSYKETIVSSIVDKGNLYKSLQENCIPLPKTWFLDKSTQLPSDDLEEYFPVIAKPRLIHTKKKRLGAEKVIMLKSQQDLEIFQREFHHELSQWLLQEIIPGPPSNLYLFVGYFDKDSQLLAHFTCRKIRQFPGNFGVGTLIVSENNKVITELSKRYLQAIGYHGICEIEYKRDPRDQKFKMMEINTRPPLFIGLASSAGVDINVCAYRDLTGNTVNSEQHQIDGVLWRHLEFDLRRKMSSLFHKDTEDSSLFDVSESFSKTSPVKKTGPIWSAQDIRPALSLPLYYLNKGIRRVFLSFLNHSST